MDSAGASRRHGTIIRSRRGRAAVYRFSLAVLTAITQKITAIPVTGVEAYRVMRKLSHRVKVVSLTYRPHFTTQKHNFLLLILISVKG
jgi:hypothetical protein